MPRSRDTPAQRQATMKIRNRRTRPPGRCVGSFTYGNRFPRMVHTRGNRLPPLPTPALGFYRGSIFYPLTPTVAVICPPVIAEVTETAGPTSEVHVDIVGDQDEDDRVTSAGICLAGEVLLSADEARQTARHLIAAADELSDLDASIKP
jgi:hypothetical protein